MQELNSTAGYLELRRFPDSPELQPLGDRVLGDFRPLGRFVLLGGFAPADDLDEPVVAAVTDQNASTLIYTVVRQLLTGSQLVHLRPLGGGEGDVVPFRRSVPLFGHVLADRGSEEEGEDEADQDE